MFKTTNWAVVESLKTNPREAMESIARTYGLPLYAFVIRERRCAPDDALDLVQGFFLHCLKKDVLQQADATKGKFRTWLLSCFKNYAFSVGRHDSAIGRVPFGGLRSLQEQLERFGGSLEPRSGESPDMVFERTWRESVLRETLAEYEAQCRRLHIEARFEIFRRRVVAPVLDDVPTPTLKELGEEFGLSILATHRAVKGATTEFKALVDKNLRRWVGTESEAKDDTEILLSGFADGIPEKDV